MLSGGWHNPLQSMAPMLQQALRDHYAIGQFNINGLLWVQAVLEAAEAEQSPVILAASDRLVQYLGGFKTIVGMVEGVMEEMKVMVPVALHLDHGTSPNHCRLAIDAGFTSVMIDGSHHPIADNIAMTRLVVDYAHDHTAAAGMPVSVEAEVGTVGGMEDGMVGGIQYADPGECLRLVRETGVDALAAALGSVHGLYQGEPDLAFDRMKLIRESVGVPLVLHGASGIPLHQVLRAIEYGHAKINVNTETLQAWAMALRQSLAADAMVYDPRTILTPTRHAMVTSIRAKMREFGSSGRG